MTFVFRNNTIERFMPADYQFSGYGDISVVPADATDFVWWYQLPVQFSEAVSIEQLESMKAQLELLLPQIGNRQMILLTMDSLFSVPLLTGNNQLERAMSKYNNFLYDLADSHKNIRVIDFRRFARQYSAAELVDWKYYMISQTPINPKLSVQFKQWYSNELRIISQGRKKCLVVDLDNTLWAGILGEDGLGGIQMSGDYPGKAFHLWQSGLKELQRAGVILCICSKNNAADVEQVWQQHADMLLKKEDFAAVRINWQDKATNIRELAAELNIGLDSMVFVDDSPTEREIVRQLLPEVSVPEFPVSAYELPVFYKQLVEQYFQQYVLTAEDRQKTAQYAANAARAIEQSKYADMNDYLRSLQIKISVEPLSDVTLSRAAQMTQKTNQFNLTTKRYTEVQLSQMLQKGYKGYTLSVADRFGDSGVTGLAIVSAEGEIDTFLLSCRVLGKGIETAFLKSVLKAVRQAGMHSVKALYVPTSKNQQTKDFYANSGFALLEATDECSVFGLDIDNADLSTSDIYNITMNI